MSPFAEAQKPSPLENASGGRYQSYGSAVATDNHATPRRYCPAPDCRAVLREPQGALPGWLAMTGVCWPSPYPILTANIETEPPSNPSTG